MRKLLKWAARIVGTLLALAILVAGYLWFQANRKQARTFAVTPAAIEIPTGEAALAEGKRLATVYCSHCHTADFGGDTMIDGPLARIDTSNLTPHPGSATATYTDLDWVRTIRHGVRKDGRSLMIMPSVSFWHLSDADLGAIIAYLKSAPAVDRQHEPRTLRPLGIALVGAGLFDGDFSGAVIDHAAPRPVAPVKEPSVAYGQYLTASFGCYHCHGQEFAGQQPPDPKAPFAPNLTQGGALKEWNEEIFLKMARTRPGRDMPWKALGSMNDDELRSVWRYLSSLPPKATPAVS